MYTKNESVKVLSPKNDYLFKLLFFDENDKNDILKKLLQDCIEFDNRQVSEITLIDRTMDREEENDKSIIFDVNAKLSDGTLVNVEIQKFNQNSFTERSIFYAGKRLASQGAKGSEYGALKQTVSLNIVDFDLFNDTEKFYSTFYLMEKDRHTKLSDILRIDFLELQKLDLENIQTSDKKALWVKFFNAESKEELDMLKEADVTFEKTINKLVHLSSDPSVLTAYEQREKVRMDEIARLQYATEQGIEQGLEIKIKESVFNMLEEKVPAKSICKFLNISEEKLKDLEDLYCKEHGENV